MHIGRLWTKAKKSNRINKAKSKAFTYCCKFRHANAKVKGGAESWNARDGYLEETLERLLNLHGPDSKVIVWEPNKHISDSRYTDRAHVLPHLGKIIML